MTEVVGLPQRASTLRFLVKRKQYAIALKNRDQLENLVESMIADCVNWFDFLLLFVFCL